MSLLSGRYTRQVLRPGEEVITVGGFHWLYTAIAILCLLLLGWLLTGFVIFAWMMIEKWTTEIVMTSDRLIYKRGWFARHVEEIPLTRIEGVVLSESLTGRVLGYGRICMSGTGGSVIQLPSILSKPIGFWSPSRAGIDAANYKRATFTNRPTGHADINE